MLKFGFLIFNVPSGKLGFTLCKLDGRVARPVRRQFQSGGRDWNLCWQERGWACNIFCFVSLVMHDGTKRQSCVIKNFAK